MTELLFLENGVINVHHIIGIHKSTKNEYFNQPAYIITLNIENYRTCPITQDTKLFNTKEIWYFNNGNDYFAIENFIENKRNEYIAKNIKNGYLMKENKNKK